MARTRYTALDDHQQRAWAWVVIVSIVAVIGGVAAMAQAQGHPTDFLDQNNGSAATAAPSVPEPAPPSTTDSPSEPSASPSTVAPRPSGATTTASKSPDPDACLDGDKSGDRYDGKCTAPAQPSKAAPEPTSAPGPTVAPPAPPPTAKAPSLRRDDCPGGDFSASRYDGSCGSRPVDNCPNGDWSSSKYDGDCGTRPVDNCPAGDYSGSRYDGDCGTPPAPKPDPEPAGTSATVTVSACTFLSSNQIVHTRVVVEDPNNDGYVLTIRIGDRTQVYPRSVGSRIYFFDRYGSTQPYKCSASVS